MTEDTLKIVKDAPKLRTPDYEGPQVVEPYAYPEPVYGDTDKEAIHTNHYYAPVAPTPQEKRTCGLKRKHFVILMAVVIVAVIAAAVGGGVGGSLANKVLDVAESQNGSSASSAATTSISSSSSASSSVAKSSSLTASSATATPSGMGSYNCPSDNGTLCTSSVGNKYTFRRVCDIDWPGGVAGIDGSTVSDISAVIAYSLDSCIDQCVAQRSAGGECSAVTYGANLTLALSRGGISGNCFLKNQRAVKNVADTSGQEEAGYLESS